LAELALEKKKNASILTAFPLKYLSIIFPLSFLKLRTFPVKIPARCEKQPVIENRRFGRANPIPACLTRSG
jgi:hypothetical protein